MLTGPAGTALRAAGADTDVYAHKQRNSRPYEIVPCGANDSMREVAETFVREAFQRIHHASIRTFMPTLLVLTDSSGLLHAVAGCRVATTEPLFLEQYLSRPIEAVLTERAGERARRAQIAEIGNFAARSARTARRFMALLPYYLLDRELLWATFTATAAVRRILQNVGARCMDLGTAEGACVRAGADDWGRYYTNDPRVMAGYLPLARRIPTLRDVAYGD